MRSARAILKQRKHWWCAGVGVSRDGRVHVHVAAVNNTWTQTRWEKEWQKQTGRRWRVVVLHGRSTRALTHYIATNQSGLGDCRSRAFARATTPRREGPKAQLKRKGRRTQEDPKSAGQYEVRRPRVYNGTLDRATAIMIALGAASPMKAIATIADVLHSRGQPRLAALVIADVAALQRARSQKIIRALATKWKSGRGR